MPHYVYEIQDSTGNIIRGSVEAIDEKSIAENFRGNGFLIVSIKKETKSVLDIDMSKYFTSVSTEEVINFNMQLTTMIESGITLLESLTTLEDQIDNKKFKSVVSSIIQDIENGMMFYEAIERHPTIFSNFYSNMIKIGETGGILQSILQKITVVMENEYKLKQEVKSALAYPFVLITVAISVVIFLVTFVLPKFTAMFASKKANKYRLLRLQKFAGR